MDVTSGAGYVPSEEARVAARRLRINPRIAEAAVIPVFSESECDAILAACDDDAWADVPALTNRAADRTKVEQAVPGGNGGWIAERIAAAVGEVNDEIFHFELLGLEEPVRIMSYTAEEEGFFDEHIDLSARNAIRKLTFSLLVSDPCGFEGGDLVFRLGPFTEARRRGAMAVFPSFLLHGVSPVTLGQRVVVVGWVVGPTFV